jgi:NADH-quinone oxidoreductase subunit L
VLFGDYFKGALHVLSANDVLTEVGEEFHGSAVEFLWAGCKALPVWLAALGVFTAWLFFLKRPDLADAAERRFKWLHSILINKFGFDWFYENVIVAGARRLGGGLWRFGDQIVIDDGFVNGSARTVGWLGSVMRYAQSGYLYHYAFAMILGLASLLMWLLWRT